MGSLLPCSWVEKPMTNTAQLRIGTPNTTRHAARLDLVVPFTNPELTRTAISAANRLGTGLDSSIRLIKVQVVPWPMDLHQSPVPIEFLEQQLSSFRSDIPTRSEIVFARELEAGLAGALHENSLILLATKNRPWRTRTERLAAHLQQAGYRVLLISMEKASAEKEEHHA